MYQGRQSHADRGITEFMSRKDKKTMSIFPNKKYKRITDKKHRNLLTLLCAGIYFVSYMTRINYKAVLSAIIESEGITKADASLALTGLFIVYGIGQLVSGWLGDRVKPKYLIGAGLLLATAMNILLPLKTDKIYMLVVWSVNGFGQAMMWPPIVRTLNDYLSGDDYVFAAVKVSWGSCFATILVYLLVPALLNITGWKSIFYICSVFGAVGAVVSFAALGYFENYSLKYGTDMDKPDIKAEEKTVSAPKLLRSDWVLVILIWFVIVLQGALRDGVDSWMPTYLSENFGVATWVAIMTGVLLPLATLVFYRIATLISEKIFKDEFISSAVFFGFSALVCIGLLGARRLEGCAWLSVACFVLIVGTMHGINMILTGIIPRAYRKYGNVSFISGVLNCGTYVGSAIFTWGIAALSESAGWDITIISWALISLAGLAFCFALKPVWMKFKKK